MRFDTAQLQCEQCVRWQHCWPDVDGSILMSPSQRRHVWNPLESSISRIFYVFVCICLACIFLRIFWKLDESWIWSGQKLRPQLMERQFQASGEDTTIRNKQKLIEIEFAKYIRVSRCQLSARDCLKRTASYCMKFRTDRYFSVWQ
jgi:hypothetical protein